MNALISQLRFSDSAQPQHSHYHLSGEMVFVESGEACFRVDGKEYLARSGSIVFINSFEQHEVAIRSTPYRRYFAIVSAAELERAFPLSSLPAVFKNRPSGFCHCVDLSAEGGYPLCLFRRLREEYEANAPQSEQMIRSILEQILILVSRACPQDFSFREGGPASRIKEVQRYIEAHFTEELKISALADRFFLNHCYLTHLFKNQVGYSPKQYILLNRLSYAQELLETTSLQVAQIAFKCGFGDANNFIRAFREWYGVSPNQYRQSRQTK